MKQKVDCVQFDNWSTLRSFSRFHNLATSLHVYWFLLILCGQYFHNRYPAIFCSASSIDIGNGFQERKHLLGKNLIYTCTFLWVPRLIRSTLPADWNRFCLESLQMLSIWWILQTAINLNNFFTKQINMTDVSIQYNW